MNRSKLKRNKVSYHLLKLLNEMEKKKENDKVMNKCVRKLKKHIGKFKRKWFI